MENAITTMIRMKHELICLLSAIALLCGGGSLMAQETQVCDVKLPAVGDRNTETVEISRVECTPQATTVYMEAYNRKGYWIRLDTVLLLRGTATGREYPLQRCEGVALGKQVYMPASGNVSFRLVFPPLDVRDTSFDFMEGSKDGWFIKDVNLKEEHGGKLHCRLWGAVADTVEASRLVLHRAGLDARVKPFVSIPVHDGKFEYDLYTDDVEAWELYLWHEWINGAWRPISFLNESTDLHFTFPVDKRPVLVTDGVENGIMRDLKQRADSLFRPKDVPLYARLDSLFKADAYFSPAFQEWRKRAEKASDEEMLALYKERDLMEQSGAMYTPQANALMKAAEAVRNEEVMWKTREVARRPSMAGFYFVRTQLEDSKSDSLQQALCAVYDSVYVGFHPGHPFHEEVAALRQSVGLVPGKRYPDYAITANDGRSVQVSDLIGGKVALVDLWASWCGPCRRNSKDMIPVYEEFKDKGFTIVGIAREKHFSDMEQAVKKDGYPWACYAEVGDANRIWARHGLGHAAGGTFLVDSDGTLLAVGASADEVREILRKKLGDK